MIIESAAVAAAGAWVLEVFRNQKQQIQELHAVNEALASEVGADEAFRAVACTQTLACARLLRAQVASKGDELTKVTDALSKVRNHGRPPSWSQCKPQWRSRFSISIAEARVF